jgi:hypothetical protein
MIGIVGYQKILSQQFETAAVVSKHESNSKLCNYFIRQI